MNTSHNIPSLKRTPRALQAAMVGLRRERRERAFQALYMAGSTGYATAQEIRSVLEANLGLVSENSSIRRAVGEDLPQLGLAIVESHHYIRNSRLSLIRLTEQGRKIYDELFGPPVESEWDRMIQEHAGDRFIQHTVGVLAFCMQARRHGWQAVVLPDNGPDVQPDILAWPVDHRPLFVEFETRARNKLQKWVKARRVHGYVAVCTFTRSRRTSLVRECQKAGVPGFATDLESLTRLASTHLPDQLWLEKWGRLPAGIDTGLVYRSNLI